MRVVRVCVEGVVFLRPGGRPVPQSLVERSVAGGVGVEHEGPCPVIYIDMYCIKMYVYLVLALALHYVVLIWFWCSLIWGMF